MLGLEHNWHGASNRNGRSTGLALLYAPLKENAFLCFGALAILFGAAGLTLVQAGALRAVFDGLEMHHPKMTEHGIVTFTLALAWSSTATVLSNYLQQLCGTRAAVALRHRAVRSLLAATMGFYDQHLIGDLANRLAGDARIVGGVVMNDLFTVVTSPILMFASAAYLWTMSPTLALLILPIGPVLVVAQRLWRGRIYHRNMVVRTQDGLLNQTALDMFRGISHIKAFQIEPAIDERYRSGIKALTVSWRRAYSAASELTWVTSGFGSIPFVVVVGVGGILVTHGRLELGTLVAAIQLMNRIVGPFTSASQSFGNIQSAGAALDRLQTVTDAPIEVTQGSEEPGSLRIANRAPTIECHDLRFGYGDHGPILRGLSLVLDPGKFTVIMGPNGSGKTTLTKLWLGFYGPESGHMTWDGHRWEALGSAWIRANTAYVPQDLFLLDGTVFDSLSLVAPSATREAMCTALARVGLPSDESFLQRPVGEAGKELSGGQRLRLSIARALLRDCPFWILDEPTAALDPDGIERIAYMIRDLAGGRTVVAITHSREVAMLADRVWVVEGGTAMPKTRQDWWPA